MGLWIDGGVDHISRGIRVDGRSQMEIKCKNIIKNEKITHFKPFF